MSQGSGLGVMVAGWRGDRGLGCAASMGVCERLLGGCFRVQRIWFVCVSLACGG